MNKGDILSNFFSLKPFLAALFVWFWGFGSLVFYGWETKVIKSVVFKTPGVMIGDFFIIPFITYLIVYFYQAVEHPLPEVASPLWSWISCGTGLILALISAIRFGLLNIWFVPHIIFYWFMAYIFLNFLSKGIYQLIFGGEPFFFWIMWAIVLIGILIHIALGVIWPKRFPNPS